MTLKSYPPEFWSSDARALADVRRFNRTLAWLPRLKIRNRIGPIVMQSLMRLSQLGGDYKLARRGLRIEERLVGVDGSQVSVRILKPAGTPRGVVLDVHGGAWVIGNARMNDSLNAATVIACNVVVVSIDYRLVVHVAVQEVMDDCLTATRWLLGNGLTEYADLPVVMVGESAGGHLAAATLLRLRAWPNLLRRLSGAVLYYGVYDLGGTPSVRNAGPETLVLDGPGMINAVSMLTPGLDEAQRRQAPLSPLYGEFEGLPPALMFAGELDPLRDDTTEMAKKWGEFADVEVHLLPESPHGFIHFPTLMAKQVLSYAHEWIRDRIEAGGCGLVE